MKIIQTFLFETDLLWKNKTKKQLKSTRLLNIKMMKSEKWGKRGEKNREKNFFLKKSRTRIRTRVLHPVNAQRYPLDHTVATWQGKNNNKYWVTHWLALNYTQNLHDSIFIMQFE